MNCLICNSSKTEPLFVTESPENKNNLLSSKYFYCSHCNFRYLNPKLRLSVAEEKQRYHFHENDKENPAYQKFVGPLFEKVLDLIPIGSRGLDFGSGKSSAMAHLLTQAGYTIDLYDPCFFPDTLENKPNYSFVYASEVIEHLHNPVLEFRLVHSVLKPKGIFAVMTHFFEPGMDFDSWYYRKDPTHVCFFSEQSLNAIARESGFAVLEVQGRVAVLVRK